MGANSNNGTEPSAFQENMGKRITQFVLWGTILIAVVGIIFAFDAVHQDDAKVKSAFSILQYVFGALLPLWGTWIGTVLAYYYSKQNFESANASVRQLVDKVTSEKKLDSIKAADVMIVKKDLIAQTIADGQAGRAAIKLKADGLDYLAKNNIKRVILLNDKAVAQYAIHREIISLFIATQTTGKALEDLTLDDMFTHGSNEIKAIFTNGMGFISKDATLLAAKNIMTQNKSCQDVFVTQTGDAAEPVLGWITNVTIAANSIV
jgi:hypothetical protein